MIDALLLNRYYEVGRVTKAELRALLQEVHALKLSIDLPIPMLLWCPECHERHVDEGEFAEKIHHTHACQHCGHVWRPAIRATVGVQFLPGFKNEGSP